MGHRFSGALRTGEKAGNSKRGGFVVKVYHILCHIRAHKVQYSEFERFGRSQYKKVAVIRAKRESNGGLGERHSCKCFHYMSELHFVRFKEFPPGGSIVKEIPYCEIAPHRGCHGRGFNGTMILYNHLCGSFVLLATGAKGKFRNSRNAGQRLSSETITLYCRQVIYSGDF